MSRATSTARSGQAQHPDPDCGRSQTGYDPSPRDLSRAALVGDQRSSGVTSATPRPRADRMNATPGPISSSVVAAHLPSQPPAIQVHLLFDPEQPRGFRRSELYLE